MASLVIDIRHGDALEVLKTLPSETIDCCITSPPYWNLRDYGVEGQIGLEKYSWEYISKLIKIFDEVRRVLKKTGTCWVVIGDTYKPDKSLGMIPELFAIAMINRQWILRNKIIWYKPNPMPSSTKDRFTIDYEYVYFFTKSPKYYFETQYEPLSDKPTRWHLYTRKKPLYFSKQNLDNYKKRPVLFGGKKYPGNIDNSIYSGKPWNSNGHTRIKRCVWKIPTSPYVGAHFAVFPEKLIETPVKAGCPPSGLVLDPFMGSGTVGVVAMKNARNFVGIELNPDYIKLAEKRLEPWKDQQQLCL